uniref:2-oxoglutarate and iron dependent oxygenase domain containing 2 n=1 Tax=Sciurus vulgaris TaxID=55149 RepID=A0A8D2D668_SCIVU
MATARASRRFCRCACFCSENLYVARYGLHLRFRGEQQLRQDYGPLEQEVERRRRLGQESAARKALIASSYHPARPEVYDSLQDAALAPEFLSITEYSASPGADLQGLLQRLQTVSEEKRIYRVPVFTAPFCQALLEELEHFERSDMPKGRPNTMNNYGVLLHELGLDEPLVTPLRERFLQPLMALLYPDCGGGQLDSHRAFVVKYAPGQDRELGCHYDNAELTLNVALGKAFTGGALYFGGLFQPAPLWPTLALASDPEVAAGPGVEGRKREGRRAVRTPRGTARPLDPKVERPAPPRGLRREASKRPGGDHDPAPPPLLPVLLAPLLPPRPPLLPPVMVGRSEGSTRTRRGRRGKRS